MTSFSSFLKKIAPHKFFIILMACIFIMDYIVILYNPYLPPWPTIEKTYTLFCFSIQGCILLYSIGIYLVIRWFRTGKSNTSTLCWGIAFNAYGILLIGLILQALGVPWADMTNSGIFFVYRQVMIIWAALMYNGISRIITRNTKWQLYPTLAILASGYSIFIVCLFALNLKIEYMMYIFTYSIWCPICILIVYLFWLYSKMSKIRAPKILVYGFLLLTITYLGWAPTHATYNYYIIYATFNLANTLILIGFLILPYEMRIKQLLKEKEEGNDESNS